MKIKFSREVPYTPTWNGTRDLPEEERVQAVIKPMTVKDLLLVMDAMGRRPGQPEEQGQMDMAKLMAEAGNLLPRYVTITGLEDENGPVSVEDTVKYGAYTALAAELLMECARASMPSEAAEKN